jgi:heavy metal efflux system protein
MINRIVQFALKQRFLVLMLVGFIVIAGGISFQRMPVDAYPDLSPPMVEIITQWPGHAAEDGHSALDFFVRPLGCDPHV